MLNSIKIPTYREVVFLSVEVLFPTALSQGGRSINITSYHFLYFFNTNDFISYFLIPSTCFPLSCHSQFDVTLFQ